jgi:hypothetical protein
MNERREKNRERKRKKRAEEKKRKINNGIQCALSGSNVVFSFFFLH